MSGMLDDARRHLAMVADIGADAKHDPLKWQVAGGPARRQHAELLHAAVCALVAIGENLERIADRDRQPSLFDREPF